MTANHKLNTTRATMLVGPRSTKVLTYGMSIGFDLLISGFEELGLPHTIIDRSQGMVGRQVGMFTIGGAFATLKMLAMFLVNLRHVSIVYLTVGTSKAGFIRDMIMIWLARLSNKRIVIHLKGGGFLDFYTESARWFRLLLRKTIAETDTIIVLGELLRDQFSFIADVDSKLIVVPNGLPGALLRNEQKGQSADGSKSFGLLYLSNMIPSKGYLDLLEACRILCVDREIPIKCDFCGAFVTTVNDDVEVSSVSAENTFHRLVAEKGLTNNVRYHGTVRGERKQSMLQKADVFVLPTAYPWEGQPISIIEALAYGLPVVTTRYRGIPEQVIDGYNGFLLEEKSPQAIADAVEKLWRDPILYKQYSQNAIEHYERNFTREAHLSRLIPAILGTMPKGDQTIVLDEETLKL
jgi:glycosyltransferase involved in cell wall biosynthesis